MKSSSAKSIVILFASISTLASTASIAANVAGAAPQSKLIAHSNAVDSAAKQITRAVANESLKTISTKDKEAASPEGLVVERLEDDGPIVLPSKIVSEPAPGTQAEDREPAAEAPAKVESTSADKALTWLQNGNKRYLGKSKRADGKSQTDRDRLAKGQHPHAVVLSCSDSRVPTETVFDQSLGEIYTVRTSGEALDASVIASLEYAVEHFGPRLLVVMGHTGCEAVSNAIAAKDGESAGSPSLDALYADIKMRVPNRGPASQSVETESAANAKGVASDLLSRSKIIRERVEKGDLVIKSAIYYLDSGVVKFH